MLDLKKIDYSTARLIFLTGEESCEEITMICILYGFRYVCIRVRGTGRIAHIMVKEQQVVKIGIDGNEKETTRDSLL
jgi:hypothetical protein